MPILFRAAASAALVFALILDPAPSSAQNRQPNQAGQFDFYVLALSWSPSFCAAAEERTPQRAPVEQCEDRPFSFVVHGLWPQYEKGFPQYCQKPAPPLDGAVVSIVLDLMPSKQLVLHEWERHGTCSGLAPRAYFDELRQARTAIKIPVQYRAPASTREVAPSEIEDAFIAANPGLTPGAVSVTCDHKRMREVRICL
ncbi:MAG: ribonuclease T2, partial [Xanthobacteraceae bacterium]